MTSRAVRVEHVKTLADWVARWPKAPNLDFDPETREPTVYSIGADGSRSVVRTIPWERELDTVTLVTCPGDFAQSVVDAGVAHMAKIRERDNHKRHMIESQLSAVTGELLEKWREYRAAEPGTTGIIMREILELENSIRDLEGGLVQRRITHIACPPFGCKDGPTVEAGGKGTLGIYCYTYPIRPTQRGIAPTATVANINAVALSVSNTNLGAPQNRDSDSDGSL